MVKKHQDLKFDSHIIILVKIKNKNATGRSNNKKSEELKETL